jgi:hypothetical protein
VDFFNLKIQVGEVTEKRGANPLQKVIFEGVYTCFITTIFCPFATWALADKSLPLIVYLLQKKLQKQSEYNIRKDAL